MAAAIPDCESPTSLNQEEELDSEIESIMNNHGSEMDDVEKFIKKNQMSIQKSKESLKKLNETIQGLMSTASSRKADLERRSRDLANVQKAMEEITMEDINREEEELKSLLTGGFPVWSLTTEAGDDEVNVISNVSEPKNVQADKKADSPPSNGDIVESVPSALNGRKSPSPTNSNRQCSNNSQDTGHDAEISISDDVDVVSQIQELSESLSLKLVKATQDMIIVQFNNIDSSSDSYRFTFTLDGSNTYLYLDCVPQVDDIEPMIEALNTHRNLARFLKKLRTEFTDLSKENGSAV